MAWDIAHFMRTNRVIFIWLAFFWLIYLMLAHGLFGLLFVTYILCFLFHGPITWLDAKTRLPRWFWTTIIYGVFVAVILTLLSVVVPRLGAEATDFLRGLPMTLAKVRLYLDGLARSYEDFEPVIAGAKEFLTLEGLVGVEAQDLVTLAINSFDQATTYASYFLLGTLFSYMILLDYPRLREQALQLRESRLKEVIDEVSGSVVRFAVVVGEGFKAQFLISCANTMITTLGLITLRIEPVALLSVIVFAAGLIPVLGVFISSLPILLVAFNTGGFSLALWALGMVLAVHLFEAYVLNPRIFSAVFRISPVLTLVVLFLAYNFFGLWGMILGVPVTVFVYRDLIRPGNGSKGDAKGDGAPGDGAQGDDGRELDPGGDASALVAAAAPEGAGAGDAEAVDGAATDDPLHGQGK